MTSLFGRTRVGGNYTLRIVSVWFSISVSNYQKHLREKRFYLAYTSMSLSIMNQGRNLESEMEAKTMKECRCLFFMTCSVSLLKLQLKFTFLRVASPTLGWTLLHQSLSKKMPHRLAYGPLLWRHFFELRLTFFKMTQACVKLTKNSPAQEVIFRSQ